MREVVLPQLSGTFMDGAELAAGHRMLPVDTCIREGGAPCLLVEHVRTS